MAARTVTTFTNYLDHGKLVPRAQILQATPDNTLNDQQFCLEVEQVVVSDVFPSSGHGSGSFTEVCRYYVKNRDMCGVSSTETGIFTALCWVSGTTQARVAATTAAGQYQIAFSNATPQWVGPSTTIVLKTDGTIEEVLIETKVISGPGPVYCWGVGIFTGS